MLTLNPASAKSADNLSSGIKETGKYIGIFTRAEQLQSQKGTKGVGLSFKSDDGQTADYLDLYTVNSKNEELPSAKTVNAILAVLMLRGAKVDNIEFEKWDKESKSRVTFEGPGYPDLMNKKIGLLLQKELASDQNGEDRERMIIVGVFQAQTELTASEVLGKKTAPEKLSKMVESLMARPVRDSRKGGGKPHQAAGQQHYNGGPMPDDDIPFAPIARKSLYSI